MLYKYVCHCCSYVMYIFSSIIQYRKDETNTISSVVIPATLLFVTVSATTDAANVAGAAVGGCAGVVVIVCIVGYVWFRLRRRQQQQHTDTA